MPDYWDEAHWLLEILLKKTRSFDKTGKDIFFTYDSTKRYEITNEKSIKALLEPMDKKEVMPDEGMRANIHDALGRMFNQYLESLDKYFSKPRDQVTHPKRTSRFYSKNKSSGGKKEMPTATLIFLTDGKWPGYKERDGWKHYEELLKSFTTQLEARGLHVSPKNRPYSIELVQFGDDGYAANLLEYLDDNLKFKGIP
jgi:hypothetical protein